MLSEGQAGIAYLPGLKSGSSVKRLSACADTRGNRVGERFIAPSFPLVPSSPAISLSGSSVHAGGQLHLRRPGFQSGEIGYKHAIQLTGCVGVIILSFHRAVPDRRRGRKCLVPPPSRRYRRGYCRSENGQVLALELGAGRGARSASLEREPELCRRAPIFRLGTVATSLYLRH